jgi:predicted MPP superfamily phosphohydrolase
MSTDTPDFHRELRNSNRKIDEKLQKSWRNSTRREWIKYSLFGGAGFLASAGYLAFEAQWLEVKEKEIQLKSLHPKANIRILHLSDLHLSHAVSLKYLEGALKLGLEQSPDLCIITGDFITDRPGAGELLAYGKLLRHFAAKLPTFACLGNHDGGAWSAEHGGFSSSDVVQELLRSAKIMLLNNEKHEIFIKGQKIDLVGLGDLWSGNCLPHSCLDRLSESTPKKRNPVFLLNHNPDAKDGLREYRWDLMLSGHTHGGQFKIPVENLAPFAPVKDRTMVDGLFNWKGRIIHITRGVGNLYGIRLNCRPEISLLKLSGIS